MHKSRGMDLALLFTILFFGFLSAPDKAIGLVYDADDDVVVDSVAPDEDVDIYDDYYDESDEDPQRRDSKSYGLISVLDKLDHSVNVIELVTGIVSRHRSMDITMVSCWDKNDNDHKALIRVTENEKEVFYGWIFSNSPSLSGMEHRKYYLKLIKCHGEEQIS